MTRFYDKKIIVSGNIVEVYEYEKLISIGECKNKNGRNGNEEVCERENEYRGIVLNRARKDVRRLINANIGAWGEKPKFVTLTFGKHVTEPKIANYEFKKFRQRLEYKLDLKLKYVTVIEFMKNGRVHYHVVFFNLPYIENEKLAEIWGHGFIKINAIEEVDNVGAYVTKYMTKDNDDERLKGEKSYFSSRGLKKPEEKKVNEKEIEDLAVSLSPYKAYEVTFENYYLGKVMYTQYNTKRKKL